MSAVRYREVLNFNTALVGIFEFGGY